MRTGFCDAMPQGLRELAKRYTPCENYTDCIRFTDTLPGEFYLVLSPGDLNGYQLEDGVWTIVTQVNPVEQDYDYQPYFRRHAAGAAPGMQGECGLTYPDDRGFDIIRTNSGDHNSLVMMLQYHWAGRGLPPCRVAIRRTRAVRCFGRRTVGVFSTAVRCERLGAARIDRFLDSGLLIRYKDLPLTLEEALDRQAVTRVVAETLFPGWTMGSYWGSGIGFGANAGYYRIDDGMLTIRRTALNGEIGGVAVQTDTMPVPLSEALLTRLQTEDISALLDTSGQGDTFLTDDAFDRTKIPRHRYRAEKRPAVPRPAAADRGRAGRAPPPLGGALRRRLCDALLAAPAGRRRSGFIPLRGWFRHRGMGQSAPHVPPFPARRMAAGHWAGVTGSHGFSDMHGTLYCGIQKSIPLSSPGCILVGSHPWGDMFTIDFTQLPLSTEEAAARIGP